jgi:hypothetical protein
MALRKSIRHTSKRLVARGPDAVAQKESRLRQLARDGGGWRPIPDNHFRNLAAIVVQHAICLQTPDRQSPEIRYPESAMSELIFIVFCSTSKMTAVDHPNIRAPLIAVMGPSSFQSSTGVTSP